MIKSILVPTSGTDTDASVFATALAAARPLAAHLLFYHVRLSATEAAVRSPHVQFCPPEGLGDALNYLQREADNLSAAAVKHFEEFCRTQSVTLCSQPEAYEEVSAQWLEETDAANERLMFRARHSDLVVIGRQHTRDLMRPRLIQHLLLGSGHPIMIAPDSIPASVTGTIMIGWKETPEAARALASAVPLLQKARTVILVGVAEEDDDEVALDHVARHLKWHGIATETRFVRQAAAVPVEARLVDAATQSGADLLVIGGYGHDPRREAIFGGVTQALIERAELAVFLAH